MTAPKQLTPAQRDRAQADLREFSFVAKTNKLIATFKFPTHVEALVFIARITVHAEVAHHYPEITFTHGQVKITLFTPEAKGPTTTDVSLAKKIESIWQRRSE